MAAVSDAHTTGAAQEQYDLRRRNLPGKEGQINGSLQQTPDRYDEAKKASKVRAASI